MGMKPEKTYVEIARALGALTRAESMGNSGALEVQSNRLESLLDTAPSGSGFDSGVELVSDESSPEKLIFRADFHHMTDSGYYDGWTQHRVIVTPSLQWGFSVKVTGRNRRGIKEFIGDVMHDWLDSDAPESAIASEESVPSNLPPDLPI